MFRTLTPTALGLTGALALLSSAAFAGGPTSPSGINVESGAFGTPIAGVLDDGTILLSLGNFGDNRLGALQPDGSVTLFATGFGALAGVAQSPVTGDIVVGDSFGVDALRVLRDLNNDGDCLDVGEDTPHPIGLPVLAGGVPPLPFDLAFAPGTDTLFVSGSTPFGADPAIGGVFFVTASSSGVYSDQFGFAADMVFDGDDLYVGDSAFDFSGGRVVLLRDGNADGDALDAGELLVYAGALNGASGLVRAADGTFYVSGTFSSDFATASVTRLAPDSDNDDIADAIDLDWSTGWGFTGGLTLFEGAGGFVPGVDGDGTLYVTNFGAETNANALRTAPLAGTSLDGSVGSFSTATISVTGAPFANAMWVLSLDQSVTTAFGIGDVCVGFSQPHIVTAMLPLGGLGQVDTVLSLGDVSSAAGLPFTLQGFTFEGGELGIGDAIPSVVTP